MQHINLFALLPMSIEGYLSQTTFNDGLLSKVSFRNYKKHLFAYTHKCAICERELQEIKNSTEKRMRKFIEFSVQSQRSPREVTNGKKI